jgi:hypothetical protein
MRLPIRTDLQQIHIEFLIESKEFSFEQILQYSAITPNKAIETTIGPIVVPNELIPPARLSLLDVYEPPRDAAKAVQRSAVMKNPKQL